MRRAAVRSLQSLAQHAGSALAAPRPGGRAANSAAAAAAAAAAAQPAFRDFVVYRWDDDRFQQYTVDVASCGPMLLDALLAIQAQQDPGLDLRVGCRRGRCGACAAIVNGRSLLPCCTPLSRDVTGVTSVKQIMPPLVPVAEKDCY